MAKENNASAIKKVAPGELLPWNVKTIDPIIKKDCSAESCFSSKEDGPHTKERCSGI